MMESNPYFAVRSSSSDFQPYGYGGGHCPSAFPVVRLRGLPFNCTDIDIFKFFAGLELVDVLLRDRQNTGRRYVEVFRCKKQDCCRAAAGEVNYEGIYDNDYHGSSPPARSKRFLEKDQMEYTEILKLRGLPFSVTKSDVAEFFEEFTLTDDKIHVAHSLDGKTNGEAFVEFASAEEAKKPMGKDTKTIGSRYVELFPSTPDEARRAESRSGQWRALWVRDL
ncbi:RNA-binding (RRM/RBD/RNP motifs) family protein [Actinidia rufa]|uniref:RNA-binding (RRM/RBD/RNP motifs) family protein n=1 Tax=Actinidia rufa TaxID=165716 RepID=A0A7J0DQZ9_9ERIC|nr:RNA-binding (RRM/RBD/RNP motifs) family protein [Actinidia rufa]